MNLPTTSSRQPTPATIVFLLAALCIVVVAVYWSGLQGGFVFDDRPNISANIALHVSTLKPGDWLAAVLSSPAANFPRPLAMWTFAVNHYFTGLDPAPMKLTNILIHAGNALLAFLLARRLLRAVLPEAEPGKRPTRDWVALFVASAWALHPINLMAVLYVVQRMESLAQSFVFVGLTLYMVGRRRMLADTGGWPQVIGGVVGCASLGALVKESAILIPLYAFCLELCFFRFEAAEPRTAARLKLFCAATLILPAVIGVALLLPPVLGPNPFPGRNFNLVERLLTETRIVVDYLGWTLYPDVQRLSLYHDDYTVSHSLLSPPTTLLSVVLLAALTTTAFWMRGRRPLAALGIFWFLSAQVLTATIIPLELVFEHRNYFASFGICLALADILLVAPTGKGLRQAGAGLAIVFLIAGTAGTALRAWEWRNPVTFAVSEAGKHPDSSRAVYAMGVALSNLSGLKADSPVAIAAFKTFDHARSIPDAGILPDQAALMLASRLGIALDPAWWVHMQDRLRSHPLGVEELAALQGLTSCAVERRCNFPAKDMMATYQVASSHGPNPEVENLMGSYLLNVLEQPDMALYLWHDASERNPREPQYRIAVIKLLIYLGRDQDAREQIAVLRGMGRFGQYNSVADTLEARRQGALGGGAVVAPH